MDEATVLTRLLSRYSPSGAERPAVEEFVRVSRALGLSSRIDRVGNGVATRGRGRPHLLFLGHIDTVEGRRPVRRDGNRIHGRGAVDAKGPLASALVAAHRYAGPGTVRVVAAVGEETDSRGARHLLRGSRPDAVIVGEPSGWQGVTIAYKGDLRVEVVFSGPRSHWSSPTPTAADLSLAWLTRLKEAFRPFAQESLYRSLTAKVVGLAADPAADPEESRLLVDIRLPPGMTTEQVLGLFPAGPGPRSVRVLVRDEPVELARTDPAVRALVTAVRSEGGEPTLLRKAGTSDLNVVVPVWKVPAVAYGPGDARLDHTDRESVDLDELRKGTAVLGRAFADLLAGTLTPRRSAAAP